MPIQFLHVGLSLKVVRNLYSPVFLSIGVTQNNLLRKADIILKFIYLCF